MSSEVDTHPGGGSAKRFTEFASTLTLDNGEPFTLEPFQRRMLRDFWAGVPQTVVVIPTGNGKTTLIAALALEHLDRVDDAAVVMVAASRDQAETMLSQAKGFIRRSPELAGRFVVHLREIRRTDKRGSIAVRASDVDKVDGVIPTLVLVDELHRHRKAELYGILADKLPKRGAQMVTISTAGAKLDSPLGEMRRQAHVLDSFTRKGAYCYAKTEMLAWHEWCLDDSEDLKDLALVKKANPASFVTPKILKRYRPGPDNPTMTHGQWARFRCGVWTEGEEPFIDPLVWDGRKADLGGLQEGDPVWVAVRAGQQGGCGIGIASPRGEGVAVSVEVLPYDFPGLRFALQRLEKRYDLRGIYVDERQFGIGIQVLEDAGLPLNEIPQTPMRLMQATATFLQLVSDQKLSHDGDLTLRSQVMSGRVKEAITGAYLEPTADTSGLIAVIVAAHEASKVSPAPLVVVPGGVG